MYKILFVDDLRNFPLIGYGDVDTVRTSIQALYKLNSGILYNEIWLDHDLGGDDTSMPIVDWLSERAFNDNPYPIDRIVIHTANPVGSKNIAIGLTRWGYSHEIASALNWK